MPTIAVLILENVPQSLRGELSRWMLEPKAGIFVGTISAMVRERLWKKACDKVKDGGCILIHAKDCEQGFAIKTWGMPSRTIEDFEGLTLVKIPKHA